MCDAVLDGALGFEVGAAGFEAGDEALVVSVAVGAVTAPGFTELGESLLLTPAGELLVLVAGDVAVLVPESFCVETTKTSTHPAASTTAADAYRTMRPRSIGSTGSVSGTTGGGRSLPDWEFSNSSRSEGPEGPEESRESGALCLPGPRDPPEPPGPPDPPDPPEPIPAPAKAAAAGATTDDAG